MTTCYKCGRATANVDPECDDCANGVRPPDAIPGGLPMMLFEGLMETRLHEIDWAKVQTVEDYRLILSHTFRRIAIPEAHPAFELLKRFLKT